VEARVRERLATQDPNAQAPNLETPPPSI
jgi:hypothetical protein